MKRNKLANLLLVLLCPLVLIITFLEPFVSEFFKVAQEYKLRNVSKKIQDNWLQFKKIYADIYKDYTVK